MEIESVGRSLAIVMIGVVAGWLLTGLVMLIRDGIRFRRGMRAQIEANQREIDLTLARAKHQQAELDGMLAAVRDSQGARFPLAAPVIDRVRGMNTPVIDGLSVNNVDQYIAAQKAIDSMPVEVHGRTWWDPSDAQVKVVGDCPCNVCHEARLRLEGSGRDNL